MSARAAAPSGGDVHLAREVLFLPLPAGSARQFTLALSADGCRVATSLVDVRHVVATSKLVLWEAGPFPVGNAVPPK